MRITTRQCRNFGAAVFLLAACGSLLQPAWAAGAAPRQGGVQAAGSTTVLKLDMGLKDECDEDDALASLTAPMLRTAAPQPAAKMPAMLIVAQKVSDPAPQTWEILPSDKTLNVALARWAVAAGWQLVWELPVDYAVETRASVQGSFQEAVTQVTKSMDSAEIPLKAIFYEGNKVLRVVGKGGE